MLKRIAPLRPWSLIARGLVRPRQSTIRFHSVQYCRVEVCVGIKPSCRRRKERETDTQQVDGHFSTAKDHLHDFGSTARVAVNATKVRLKRLLVVFHKDRNGSRSGNQHSVAKLSSPRLSLWCILSRMRAARWQHCSPPTSLWCWPQATAQILCVCCRCFRNHLCVDSL